MDLLESKCRCRCARPRPLRVSAGDGRAVQRAPPCQDLGPGARSWALSPLPLPCQCPAASHAGGGPSGFCRAPSQPSTRSRCSLCPLPRTGLLCLAFIRCGLCREGGRRVRWLSSPPLGPEERGRSAAQSWPPVLQEGRWVVVAPQATARSKRSSSPLLAPLSRRPTKHPELGGQRRGDREWWAEPGPDSHRPGLRSGPTTHVGGRRALGASVYSCVACAGC